MASKLLPRILPRLGFFTPLPGPSRPCPTLGVQGHRGLSAAFSTSTGDDDDSSLPKLFPRNTPPNWYIEKQALANKYPGGWDPRKKLSRTAIDGLRLLHRHDPVVFSTPALAQRFKISVEAVRRILASKWVPDAKRRAKMDRRAKERAEKAGQERRLRTASEWIGGEGREAEEMDRIRQVANKHGSDSSSADIRGPPRRTKQSLASVQAVQAGLADDALGNLPDGETIAEWLSSSEGTAAEGGEAESKAMGDGGSELKERLAKTPKRAYFN